MSGTRLDRERRTIKAMMTLYCRDRHGGKKALCADCAELFSYANQRLDRCPFGEEKPTCAKCPVHCYQTQQREKIRAVMKYAGPRMTLRHPILAARHLLDALGAPKHGGATPRRK
jgi:predicted amidophosphoribosyltransferase